jgi:hypothetical protein
VNELEQLRQQYESTVAIHSDLKQRAVAFCGLIAPIKTPEICRAIAGWELDCLCQRYPNPGTRGDKTSKAGYYKRLREIPLEDGANAVQVEKRDGSKVLQHIAYSMLTLPADQWAARGKSTGVADRLEGKSSGGESVPKRPILPGEFINKAIELLDSDSWVDVAVGLIALTGRRPHEIVARGVFTAVRGQPWQARFKGQGKKRDSQRVDGADAPEFEISCLAPASLIVAKQKAIRLDSDVKRIIDSCVEKSSDIVEQNRAIDSYTNKRINRALKLNFGSILPTRIGDIEDQETGETGNCKALRAAYAALITERDMVGKSIGDKLIYAGRALGHVTAERLTHRDLMHLLTTMGYMDYEISGDVPFADLGDRKLTKKVKISDSVHEWIAQKSQEWSTTQGEAIARLIEFFESSQVTKLEVSEEKDMGAVVDLQNQVNSTNEQIAVLAQQVAALTQAVAGLTLQNQSQAIIPQSIASQSIAPQAIEPKSVAPKPGNSMALATAADLWGENWDKPSRAAGATEERIDRAIKAIFAYNDQLLGYPAKEKWAIGNRVLRDLTGANGQLIAARLDVWQSVISEHHAKHGIDSEYHNRAHHRGVDVCDVIRPMIVAIDP